MNRVKSIENQLRESMGFKVTEELDQDIQDKIKANNDKMTNLKKKGAPQDEIDKIEDENDELNGGKDTAKDVSEADKATLRKQRDAAVETLKKEAADVLAEIAKVHDSMKGTNGTDRRHLEDKMSALRAKREKIMDLSDKTRQSFEDKIDALDENDDKAMFNSAKAHNKKINTEINKIKKQMDAMDAKFGNNTEWQKIQNISGDKRTPEQKSKNAEFQKEYDEYMEKHYDPLSDKVKELKKKLDKSVTGKKFESALKAQFAKKAAKGK